MKIGFPTAIGMVALVTCTAPSSGSAKTSDRTVRCLLVVDKKTEIEGSCTFTPIGQGDFIITSLGRKQTFAYVYVGDDPMIAWNGGNGYRKADINLGSTRRSGACWYNERVRACAW